MKKKYILISLLFCVLPLVAIKRTRDRNVIATALNQQIPDTKIPIRLAQAEALPKSTVDQDADKQAIRLLDTDEEVIGNVIIDPDKKPTEQENQEEKEEVHETQPAEEEVKVDNAAREALQLEPEKQTVQAKEPTVQIDTLNNEKIELQFENADLTNFIEQIETLFNVNFITNDSVTPAVSNKTLKGVKISFKTQNPLTKKEAWNLFLTFLEISGFTVVKQPEPNIYRIQALDAARRSPIPAYLGVDPETLPENDQIIRYLYFIQNSTVDALAEIVTSLKSSDAPLIVLKEHKAFLLSDKAYNVKTLMKIVKELDRVSMPQALSVLKLRNADAIQVKQLYDTLTQTGEQAGPVRPFTTRKPPTSLFFSENTKVIAEPRTNSLIILGARDAIKKIEEFIIKHVDVELDQPYSPLHVYQLKFADATTVAEIMSNVTQFGQNTPVGQTGGIRGQDKFLKNMTFTPERETNRLIIKGDYNDYLIAKDIIQKLDEQQPQVAIEVLIFQVMLNKNKELGAQIRSKQPGLDGILGNNVEFQTSGLRAGLPPQGIVQSSMDPGINRLLGNLLNLVTQATPGNTIISLGRDMFGVWGILQILQTMSNLEIISNPFVIATNKTPAVVSIGQTRRVIQGTVIASGVGQTENTLGDNSAALFIEITPQINSDGMIVLRLIVDITSFDNPPTTTGLAAGDKTTKRVETQTIIADKEVLAIGGLIRNTTISTLSKVPVLADIPVIGWLFKNRARSEEKTNILILISTRIIDPTKTEEVDKFTKERIRDYQGGLKEFEGTSAKLDPIHKLFFDKKDRVEQATEELLIKRKRGRRRVPSKISKQEQEITVQHDKKRIAPVQPTNQTQPVRYTRAPMPESHPVAHTEKIVRHEQKNILAKNEPPVSTGLEKKKRSTISLTNTFNHAKGAA